jgi:hypothetical protein
MINLRIEFEKENTSSLDLVVIMMLEADILLCWYKQPGTGSLYLSYIQTIEVDIHAGQGTEIWG